MEHLKIPATLAAAVFLAFLGTTCIFRPERMQAWAQKQYHKSTWRHPFTSLVFKPWYPTYLRFMGVWAWVFALVFAYAVYASLAPQ